MKYTDFFSCFYMGRRSGGIVGYKSKEKIPEYFMTIALPEACRERLPTSNSTYGKWFEGIRNPENTIWALITSNFDEEGFVRRVTTDLNDSELLPVMKQFEIELGASESPDKRLFASALAKQFYALAQGNGIADNIVKTQYNPNANIISFPEYVDRTKTKYEKTETPFSDGEERLLADIYVCNTLSSRIASARVRRSRTAEKIIENATLASVAEYSKKVILVANGGMGKSMMLQHLFLESIDNHLQTGLFPILIELRQFSTANDLFNDYIVHTARSFDRTLTPEKIEELMVSGKCQILMDGADEIDPTDEKEFQRQIGELSDKYPYVQYVIASRDCNTIAGIKRFSKLYLQSFNNDQTSLLITNLLKECEDPNFCNEVISYLEDDYLKKHKVFASNPMLLTFVVMKYPIVDTFEGQKRLFYRKVYDAIVHGHDEQKQGFARVFRSAQNATEFTKVFQELCASTYVAHKIEFDPDSFDEYFETLSTKDTLENPKIMTSKDFAHDACATACMMYQQDENLFYIDPGFQEYLFARHYHFADPEELIELGQILWDIGENEFDGIDAFEMLTEFSLEKVEKTLYLPYLHNIFVGKNEVVQLLLFMQYGFREFEYQVTDLDTIAQYSVEHDAEWISQKPIIMEPSSVIFSMLMKHLKIGNQLCFAVFENTLNYPAFLTNGTFGELRIDPLDDKPKIIPRRLLRQDTDDLDAYESTHNVDNWVRDNNGNLVRFGSEYKVDFTKVISDQEQYTELIDLLSAPESDLRITFYKLKEYFEELKLKYETDS